MHFNWVRENLTTTILPIIIIEIKFKLFLCLLSAGVGDICAWRWTDILGKVSQLFHIYINPFQTNGISIKLHTIK